MENSTSQIFGLSGGLPINQSIRTVVSQSNGGAIFTQFPHFEGEFLGEDLSGGKVDRVLEFLNDLTSPEYNTLCDTYLKALARDPSVLTSDTATFDTKRNAYVASNSLTGDQFWT